MTNPLYSLVGLSALAAATIAAGFITSERVYATRCVETGGRTICTLSMTNR